MRNATLVLRWLCALFFTIAGINHFLNPAFYERIIPPAFPSPHLLNLISGFFEIVGGLGLLVRPLRRAAGWGLIALLIAVFPANLYMATYPTLFNATPSPLWTIGVWVRLPMQILLIAWVWFVSLRRANAKRFSP